MMVHIAHSSAYMSAIIHKQRPARCRARNPYGRTHCQRATLLIFGIVLIARAVMFGRSKKANEHKQGTATNAAA